MRFIAAAKTQSMVRWGVHLLLFAALGFLSWGLAVTMRTKPLNMPSIEAAPRVFVNKPTDFHSAGRLFGDSTPTQSFTALPAAVATDVKLVGVIAADNPSDSLAIIEVNGAEKTLSIGSPLPDGEMLKAVTPQGATLANGQEERDLALAQQQAPMDAVFATLPVQTTAADGAAPQPVAPLPKPAPVVPVAQQMTALRQAALQVLLDRSRHNQAVPKQAPNPPQHE